MTKWKKKGLLPWCAAGLAGAAGLTALLCLVIAAAVNKGWVSWSLAQSLSLVAAGLAVLITTSAIVRLRMRQYLTTGAVIGGGYGLLCALLCALSGEDASFGLWLLWLFCVVVGCGMLGAIMSIGKNPHSRRRK